MDENINNNNDNKSENNNNRRRTTTTTTTTTHTHTSEKELNFILPTVPSPFPVSPTFNLLPPLLFFFFFFIAPFTPRKRCRERERVKPRHVLHSKRQLKAEIRKPRLFAQSLETNFLSENPISPRGNGVFVSRMEYISPFPVFNVIGFLLLLSFLAYNRSAITPRVWSRRGNEVCCHHLLSVHSSIWSIDLAQPSGSKWMAHRRDTLSRFKVDLFPLLNVRK